MTEQPGPAFWAVVAVPALVLLGASVLRLVPAGSWFVATRGGRVARVRGPGVVLRVPVVEQTVLVPWAPVTVGVVGRASTRDGWAVRVVVEAVVRALPPTPGRPHVAPGAAAALVIEDVVARELGRRDVDELPEGLVARVTHLCDEADRSTASAPADGTGPAAFAVLDLRLVELDVLLAAGGPRRGSL